ncbi:MAG TPA: DUF1634 domain-containing protein, partial [Terracidiphilus sp.]|nr:DUF1634 domain-containing protein [Terracidiphilus sp.]
MQAEDDRGLEIAMGRMLQIGVTVAALVVLVGGILYLAQFGGSRPDYGHFQSAPASAETIHGIVANAGRMDARGIIALGMLLLLATPVCRVIFGLVGFAMLRDRFYTAVS